MLNHYYIIVVALCCMTQLLLYLRVNELKGVTAGVGMFKKLLIASGVMSVVDIMLCVCSVRGFGGLNTWMFMLLCYAFFIMTTVIDLCWFRYILTYFEDTVRRRVCRYLVTLGIAAQLVLIVLNPFSGVLFSMSEAGGISTGALRNVFFIIQGILCIIVMVAVIIEKNQIPYLADRKRYALFCGVVAIATVYFSAATNYPFMYSVGNLFLCICIFIFGITTNLIEKNEELLAQRDEFKKEQQALNTVYSSAKKAGVAKSEFLSMMSHDMRTPMNAIVGMTSIAQANLTNPEKVNDCLTKIRVSSEHLMSLINQVLDINKLESGRLSLNNEPFSLMTMLGNLKVMYEGMQDKTNRELILDTEELVHEYVIGDVERMQQSFMNFIVNAIDYEPKKGSISLSVSESPCVREGHATYEFIFEDNGQNINAEYIDNVFSPLENRDRSKLYGNRWGLELTKSLVGLMDGNMEFSSGLNGSNRFTIILQLELQDELDIEGGRALEGRSILIADDDTLACESMQYVLSELGISSEYICSGYEAVELVRKRKDAPGMYDAVIVDWQMPDMDGVETVRALRAVVGPELPVLIASSFDWSDIEKEALEAGVSGFIGKPFIKSRVRHTLTRVVIRQENETDTSGEPKKDYNNVRALLAEDNELNAEIAIQLLGLMGVTTEWVQNGRDAVRKLMLADNGYYDVVFMDIQMPVMNGYDAAKAIRSLKDKDTERIPIIAMTASAMPQDIDAAMKAGMNDHIAKPLDTDRIREVLDRHLQDAHSRD